jgi:OOP family OmpA-OmpF porin
MTHPDRILRLIRPLCLGLLPITAALPAAGLELAWPDGADRVLSRSDATAGFRIATGGFDGAQVPAQELAGDLVEEIWQIPDDMGAVEHLLSLLRGQLVDQGYQIGFACADRACGGFDFRYALPIAEGPAMHVDLGDFQYLTARRVTPAGAEHLALTISHGGRTGFVHLARIAPAGALPASVTPSSRQADTTTGEGLIARLTTTGHAVLDDLAFDTGASALSDATYDSLATLADWLSENSARRVVLVGHTDTEGGLDANIELSRARAAAVRAYLVTGLGVDPAQIEAAGIGFLSPRSTNTDAAGREANRRVEVVLVGD